jgi:hypothetical protein
MKKFSRGIGFCTNSNLFETISFYLFSVTRILRLINNK